MECDWSFLEVIDRERPLNSTMQLTLSKSKIEDCSRIFLINLDSLSFDNNQNCGKEIVEFEVIKSQRMMNLRKESNFLYLVTIQKFNF